MSSAAKPLPANPIEAIVDEDGQVTIPVEIVHLLGAKAGDKITLESTSDGVKIAPVRDANVFEKYRGTEDWLPEGYEGREGIIRYFREIRGHDEIDDLICGID